MRSIKKYIALSVLKHFPDRAGELLTSVHREFELIAPDIAFAATSANPVDRRLEVCAWALALIKSLDAAGMDYALIREVCREVAIAYVQPKNAWQRFLKKVPAKFAGSSLARWFFKRINPRLSRPSHPDGFALEVLTDPEQTHGFGFGFNILECGVCKLFHRHQMNHYTYILCEVDEITSSLAGLSLIRTGTIAQGATHCDFRYQKSS